MEQVHSFPSTVQEVFAGKSQPLLKPKTENLTPLRQIQNPSQEKR